MISLTVFNYLEHRLGQGYRLYRLFFNAVAGDDALDARCKSLEQTQNRFLPGAGLHYSFRT